MFDAADSRPHGRRRSESWLAVAGVGDRIEDGRDERGGETGGGSEKPDEVGSIEDEDGSDGMLDSCSSDLREVVRRRDRSPDESTADEDASPFTLELLSVVEDRFEDGRNGDDDR